LGEVEIARPGPLQRTVGGPLRITKWGQNTHALDADECTTPVNGSAPHVWMAPALARDNFALVRQRHGYDQRRPPLTEPDHPRISFGRLRSQQIGTCPIDEQPAQITIAALGDAAQPSHARGLFFPAI
jgi:hypothetical protein